ncbi:mediator of RNA polymerase II transcription subunit 29-like [Durio zibethinus]|uniref:Mediator of RNA polymerase II transcription subunit 29-like n=1 Tax=Durio zibethinus TaxID=66656 RepID=A0A6P5ZNZ0_DURZI|nr:mediator of RNA polymerase II transcription subunit 29-like [Durio zibethinus]
MGFDNECILNIQFLAGEYFCPICGYLSTQMKHYKADSKPLVESNKTLAETIGKIMVHYLGVHGRVRYLNVQLIVLGVHLAILQLCSVQPQAKQAGGGQETAATETTAAADQTQLASQPGIATSQAQASQITTSISPGQDPNLQANPNSQSQAVSQAAVVTSEQRYQLQQQHQQFYQHHSGYDPCYQQYYPHQQQAVPQYQQQPLQVNAQCMAGQHPVYLQIQAQPQAQVQPQPQVQSQSTATTTGQPQLHSSVQAPAASQPQNQAQVDQQQQTHLMVPPHSKIPSQTYPTALGHPQPQVQPHLQHGLMPQYQQYHSHLQQPQSQIHPAPQPQPQLNPQPSQPLNPSLMPQTQHPAAYAVTAHQSYPQKHPHQQVQMVTQQHPMHMQAQGGLHPQQHPAQVQNSFPQQPPLIHPSQSHAAIPKQQLPGLLPSQSPMLPQVHPHSLQPALPIRQQPVMQHSASSMSHQYVLQQPLSTQPVGLVQPQIQQQGSQSVHPYPSHNLVGRPNPGVQSQPYPQSAAGIHVKPMQLGANQPSSYPNNVFRTNNQSGVTSQQISEVPEDHGTDKNEAEKEADSSYQGIAKKEANELDAASSIGADLVDTNTSKSNAYLKSLDEKPTGDVGDSSSGFDISTKETPESRRTFGTDLEQHRDPVSTNTVKGEALEDQKDVDKGEQKVQENKILDGPLLKAPPLQEAKLGEEQNGKMQKDKILPQDQGLKVLQPSHSVPIGDQGRHLTLHMPCVSNNKQQRPAASAVLQAPPPGPPPNQFRAQGPGHVTHPGQALVPPEN